VIEYNADMETCECIISGYTFERRAVICSERTFKNTNYSENLRQQLNEETKITENVWQYLFIKRVISQPSFAQFSSSLKTIN